MFGLGIGAWLRIGAVVAVVGALAWSHTQAYQAGKSSVLDRLKDDRITILKDGKQIDEKALNADDDGLCAFLGGCELPDDGAD